MIHALPRVATCIRHHAITIRIQALLTGQLGRKRQQLSQQSLAVLALEITNGSDVPSGDDQQMHGSLGVDVPEREGVGRALDDLGRNLSAHDPAKQTVSHAFPAVARWMQLPRPPAPRFRIAEY